MADRVGQQLGNYRLTRLLGKGGFAEVYLGEHVYLETQAAIKVLLTQLADEDMEPFRLEAKRVAYLEHPHIVRVLDFGVDGTTPYLVMNYAPNGTLRQRHPKGVVLPLQTILGYVKQAADALQYAHDEHFIHRDVKPENLLVGRRQEVLLSDFGIALLTQTSRSQSMQDVAGTASYMAPEQFQGKPRPASDQYSLGIIVYEWLSGDRPFHGSFTEIASQHLFVAPPPFSERQLDIPATVEQVVMTALAKDPHQRFANVQAFATALEQAMQTEVSQTIPANQLVPPIEVMPPTRPIQPPPEMATVPNKSPIPTELVTPPSQPSVPSELSDLSSQTAVPTQSETPLSSAVSSSTLLATPASKPSSSPIAEVRPTQQSSSPTVLARPSQSLTTKVETAILPRAARRGLSRGRMLLFIGLLLLIVVGSVGLTAFFNNQISPGDAHATAIARANATYTAGVQATSTVWFRALTATVVTATAQSQATDTAAQNVIQTLFTQSTSGTPALDDPMGDNSKGVNWDQSNVCYFGADHAYHVVEPDQVVVPCFAENSDFSNFAFQAKLTFNYDGLSNGIGNGNGIGLIYFRANAAHTTFYDLYIGISGTSGGGCTIQNTANPLLNQNLDCTVTQHTPNTLTIKAKGNQLYVFWNNLYAGMVTYSYLSHGQIGFGSAGFGLNMLVRNVKVWKL